MTCGWRRPKWLVYPFWHKSDRQRTTRNLSTRNHQCGAVSGGEDLKSKGMIAEPKTHGPHSVPPHHHHNTQHHTAEQNRGMAQPKRGDMKYSAAAPRINQPTIPFANNMPTNRMSAMSCDSDVLWFAKWIWQQSHTMSRLIWKSPNLLVLVCLSSCN